MLTRILPVMVNKSGSLSFYIAPSENLLMQSLLEFSSDQAPTPSEIIDHLPDDLLKGDRARLKVMPLDSGSEKASYFLVAGSDKMFAHLPEGAEVVNMPDTAGENRWIAQTDVKFAPVPEGAVNVNVQNHIYTGSLERDDLVALLTAVYTVRALRTGGTPLPGIDAQLALIADRPEITGRFLDAKTDTAMSTSLDASDADGWRRVAGQLTVMAREATRPLSSQADARRAEADAAKRRRAGEKPKPA